MKITFLELVGFQRFNLARLTKVSYRPTARQQLILGTNGSGKSSMLDELSPLPAHHSNFKPGGYKHIEIDHGPYSFVLRSDFKSGNRHSFLRDGVELNEGGTYQVQIRLVKEHFRYTEKLHDLLIGRTRFTEMKAPERREWITTLSESDWTYSLGIYNQFKAKARDAQGAYRHQQERLSHEVEELSKLTSFDEIKARHEQLRLELNMLLTDITPNTPAYVQISQQLDGTFDSLQREAESILRDAPNFLFDGSYSSLEDLHGRIREREEEAQFHRIHIERAGKDFSEMESMLASFGGRDLESIPDAHEQLLSINTQLNQIGDKPYFEGLTDAVAIRSDNLQILSEVSTLFGTMPDNSDKKFSRTTIEKTELAIANVQSEIDKLVGESNRMTDRLSHLQGTHDTSCPQCSHIWKEGVNPKEVEYLTTEIAKRSQRLIDLRAILDASNAYMLDANGYIALWGRFRGYVTSYPRLRPFWNLILEQGLMENHPNQQLWVIREWERSVEWTIEVEALQARQKQLEQIVESQRLMGDKNLLTEKIQTLEEEVRSHTVALQETNLTLNELRNHGTAAKRYIERVSDWTIKQDQFTHLFQVAVDAIKNKLLDEDAAKRHVEMAGLQKRMSDHETLRGIVDDISREIVTLELRYKSYQVLATILSPTEGIIAERLRDAIYRIVDQMNTIIASVWSHDMKILECGFENNDLDYKFPVMVESPDNVTNDMQRTSKGQAEMINIAFKLTAMLYLEMLEYPLFMDEPGEGFDEQHRDQIMSLIRSMLDAGHYSQLFMVSHFASSHGSFLDAEILVLDSSNIALPGTFNTHVTLE